MYHFKIFIVTYCLFLYFNLHNSLFLRDFNDLRKLDIRNPSSRWERDGFICLKSQKRNRNGARAICDTKLTHHHAYRNNKKVILIDSVQIWKEDYHFNYLYFLLGILFLYSHIIKKKSSVIPYYQKLTLVLD